VGRCGGKGEAGRMNITHATMQAQEVATQENLQEAHALLLLLKARQRLCLEFLVDREAGRETRVRAVMVVAPSKDEGGCSAQKEREAEIEERDGIVCFPGHAHLMA